MPEPVLRTTAIDTEADREAFRQFVIFVGSIAVAIAITIASFVIAAH
jgi:hypothetical protein